MLTNQNSHSLVMRKLRFSPDWVKQFPSRPPTKSSHPSHISSTPSSLPQLSPTRLTNLYLCQLKSHPYKLTGPHPYRLMNPHPCRLTTPTYLLSSSLGWFLLSRFFSMRSDRSCLSTPVAYSISPWRAVMMSEATLPRSRMEKLRWASSVRMKVSRKCFLVRSCPNNVSDFSTLACTWRGTRACSDRRRGSRPCRREAGGWPLAGACH